LYTNYLFSHFNQQQQQQCNVNTKSRDLSSVDGSYKPIHEPWIAPLALCCPTVERSTNMDQNRGSLHCWTCTWYRLLSMSLVWVKCGSLPASTSAFYTLEHPQIHKSAFYPARQMTPRRVILNRSTGHSPVPTRRRVYDNHALRAGLRVNFNILKTLACIVSSCQPPTRKFSRSNVHVRVHHFLVCLASNTISIV